LPHSELIIDLEQAVNDLLGEIEAKDPHHWNAPAGSCVGLIFATRLFNLSFSNVLLIQNHPIMDASFMGNQTSFFGRSGRKHCMADVRSLESGAPLL
jgi:hypothetical protein